MYRFLAPIAALLAIPSAVFAACGGEDWRDTLPPETMQEIRAAVADVPFREGIAFEAVHGQSRITLFGTIHSTDPAVFIPAEIAARVRTADLVFVEATAEMVRDLQQHLTSDPSLGFESDGPGLSARLTGAEWEELRKALAAYGVGAKTANRMRPWLASVMLATPLCELAAKASGAETLDEQVETFARESGVAVAALDEDYEHALAFFLDASPEQELDMLRLSLAAGAAEQRNLEDGFATAIGTWRDEDVPITWEIAREHAASSSDDTEAVAALFRRAHELLVVGRNRTWLATILHRAAAAPNIVVAVGALHLPGEHGLARLLEAEGFAVRRLAVF